MLNLLNRMQQQQRVASLRWTQCRKLPATPEGGWWRATRQISVKKKNSPSFKRLLCCAKCLSARVCGTRQRARGAVGPGSRYRGGVNSTTVQTCHSLQPGSTHTFRSYLQSPNLQFIPLRWLNVGSECAHICMRSGRVLSARHQLIGINSESYWPRLLIKTCYF